MKTILLFLFVAITFQTQGQTVSEANLVGTWKVVKYIDETKDLSEMLVKDDRDKALKSTWVFHEDHTFSLISKADKYTFKGTWKIDDAGKNIHVEYEIAGDSDINVDSLEGNKMVWLSDLKQHGKIYTVLERK